MARKLIGIDLDFTTLNNDGQVSPLTKEVLQRVQNEGHIVSIVTGRPARLSTDIYDTIGLKSPMINFNGALGHKPHQVWADEYSKKVDHEIAFDLLEIAPYLGIDMVVAESKSDVWAQDLGTEMGQNEAFFFPQDESGTKMLNRLNLRSDVNAILLHGTDKAQMDAAQIEINKRYGSDKVAVKTWGADSPVIEVAPAGVSKTTGLDFLRHVYNIEKDDIYAFGDEMNDFEMIDYATHGVVMKNGNPALKAIADDMTDFTNDEDGLAKYLIKTLKLD
jgi:Cof subfamily protein (haloacid dehalogenase superfamily)